MAFNAGDIEAQLTLDRSRFTQELRQAQSQANALERERVRIEATLSSGSLQADIQKVKDRIDALDREEVRINTELQTATLPASVARLNRELLKIRDARVTAQADFSRANNEVTRLQARLATIATARVQVDADALAANTQLIATNQQLQRIRGVHTARIRIIENGAAQRALRGQRLLIMSILAAAPLIPAALGPGTAGIVGLGAALAGAGGGALVLGAGLTGAIQRFNELENPMITTTGAVHDFAHGLNNLKTAWNDFIDVTEDRSYELMTQGLQIMTDLLPRLSPIFFAFADQASLALSGISGFMNGPEGQRMLTFFEEFGAQSFGQILSILGNLLQFFGRLFEAFGPFATGMLASLDEITAGWAEWADGLAASDKFQSFIAWVNETGPQVLDMLGSMVMAFINIGVALAPFAGPMLAGLTAIFDYIANMDPTILGAIVTGIIAAVVAFQAFAAIAAIISLLNPFTAIALAVVAVVAALTYLWTTSETFRDIVTGAWNAVRDTVMRVINYISPLFTQFGSVISGIYYTTMKPALESIGNSFSEIWVRLQELWTAAAPLLAMIGGAIGAALALVGGLIVGLVGGLLGALGPVIAGVIGFVSGVIQAVTGLVQLISAVVHGDWQDAWTAAKNIVFGLAGAIWSIITGVLGGIGGFIFGLVTSIIGYFRGLYDTLVGHSIIPDLVNGIVGWFHDLYRDGIRIVVGFINGVISWFFRLPGNIWNAVSGVASIIINAFVNARNGAAHMINDLISFVYGIGSRIWNAISGINLYNAGWNIMVGLYNGIIGMWGRVQGLFNRLTSSIPNWKGPESRDKRLLTPAGGWIMEGLMAGVESELPALRATLGAVAAEIKDGMAVAVPTVRPRIPVAPPAVTATQPATDPNAVGAGASLGRNIYVTLQAYNPVAETTSQTAVKEIYRLAELGGFG